MAKELLFSLTKKDFTIEWFSGTGNGGQNRNKHQNCCRIKHPASDSMSTGQSYKERTQNQKEAFTKLMEHPKFKIWHNNKVYEILTKKTIAQRVEDEMNDKNIKQEIRVNGKWVEIPKELIDMNISTSDWECEKSPLGFCVYDMNSDYKDDDCIYCHQPDERK